MAIAAPFSFFFLFLGEKIPELADSLQLSERNWWEILRPRIKQS